MKNLEKIGASNLVDLRRAKAISVGDVIELYPAERYLLPATADYLHKVEMPPGCMFLREGAQWIEPGFRSGSGRLTHERSPDDRVECKVTFPIAGDGPEIAVAERKLKGSKWLLVVQDMNRLVKLVGTREHPLTANVKFSTEQREWLFEFTGTTDMLPYYLPGYSVDLLTGDGAGFDTGFDFGFDS